MLELLFLLYLATEDGQLSPEDRRRRDRRTPRLALRKYNQSAFYYLFGSGNEQALLNCCGVDHSVFRKLLVVFEPVWKSHTIDRSTGRIKKLKQSSAHGLRFGRKREIDATGSLGLVLYWYRTRGSVARSTAMAFGLTSSPMYSWLKFSRWILLYGLQYHPSAKISLPSSDDIEKYVEAIGAKYFALHAHRVWSAMDGLKLRLQKSTDWAIQNRYYNGWGGNTYVNCVFVFAPDGRIRICTLNAPGTFHDSTMADYGVYDKIEQLYDEYQVKVVVDSAFNVSKKNYLIKSAQQDPESQQGVILNRQATALRQLSEHGMRMIQGQFPRLKDPMELEEFGDRKVILNLMVLLYNFQASEVGINHILNSFMSRTEGFYSYEDLSETANDIFNT